MNQAKVNYVEAFHDFFGPAATFSILCLLTFSIILFQVVTDEYKDYLPHYFFTKLENYRSRLRFRPLIHVVRFVLQPRCTWPVLVSGTGICTHKVPESDWRKWSTTSQVYTPESASRASIQSSTNKALTSIFTQRTLWLGWSGSKVVHLVTSVWFLVNSHTDTRVLFH